jgi:hypothetical protein
MNRRKRGQAAGAAVLVAIIAVIIIGFVILIPPSDRAKLLDEDKTTSRPSSSSSVSESNLIIASPGRIDYLTQREIEHPLPTINVFTRTEGKILAEKNLVSAKRGAFSDDQGRFIFEVVDLKNTGNVLLSFNVIETKGRLKITLNGDEVFNSELGVGVSSLITLPKNSLSGSNELIFSLSSPGLAFWSTNLVNLNNVKIVADVTDVGAQFSRHVFLISETEKNNLEKVKLKFQPSCTQSDVGRLTIDINGNEIYSAVPDCALNMVPIEFSPTILYAGENQVTFNAEGGTYILSHVLVESDLSSVEFPTYYFDVSNNEYEEVKEGNKRLRLELNFVDVVSSKYGSIVFNGHTRSFDTKEIEFVTDISEDIVRGTNAVKIKPKKTIEVRELRVDLVN